MDQGLELCGILLKSNFPYVEDDELIGVVDFKTQFQEFVHSQNKGDVMYRLVKEEGPAHHRLFTSEVILEQQAIAHGQERLKRIRTKAAERAYHIMRQHK